MNSLKAFLSPCEVITIESNLHKGVLTVLMEGEQPAQIFDRTGQSQPFQVISIADPESLTKQDVATLDFVAQQTKWIVIVDHSGQVHGIIDPESNAELLIATKTRIQKDELGSAIALPIPTQVTETTPPSPQAHYLLREWWHQLLRDHQRYRCYAFFLCLSTDKNAIEYITNFGKELDALSGKNCLIIFLSSMGFRRSRYDKAIWNFATNEHIHEGYSVTVANLFKIKYEDFPCIVLFESMHSPKKVPIYLKGLNVDEIANRMREIFTVVQESVTNGKDPIFALEHYQGAKRLNQVGLGVLNRLFSFAGKTFAVAVEEWIKTLLK